ncbi:hypothetical secreted protein [Azoarcus olearius]|uniref:Hypothetical secreted protein n=1 Tax=Azoarcus sp. (strain BH72) TaxID=418699 RepID=A1K3A9_AZOSB|nr:hypothetical secreted protein [Azoarcus olearius]
MSFFGFIPVRRGRSCGQAVGPVRSALSAMAFFALHKNVASAPAPYAGRISAACPRPRAVDKRVRRGFPRPQRPLSTPPVDHAVDKLWAARGDA